MGESLEVSVSFGRFENDSLSWEKWSSFSPNKYVEEVEKCSTPGSVAEKKAYFEAHYKKIAARRAEILLEREKQNETMLINGYNYIDQGFHKRVEKKGTGSVSVSNDIRVESVAELEVSNGQGSNKGIKEDAYLIHVENSTDVEAVMRSSVSNSRDSPKRVELDANSVVFAQFDILDEDEMITIEPHSFVVKSFDREKDSIPNSPEVKKLEEAVLVQEDTHQRGSLKTVALPEKSVKERGNTPGSVVKNSKTNASIKSQKISPAKKEKTDKNSIGVKKKPALSLTKSPKTSTTQRLPKPTKTPTVLSASRSSMNKSQNSSFQRKNLAGGENKRVAPTSMHMSLNLGSTVSDSSSLTTTRKSMIMERMGDKDIVKRAFKTFQNSFNQLRTSSDNKSLGTNLVSTKETKPKVPAPSPRKENDRTRKSAERTNAPRDQSRTRRNYMTSGSSKQADVDRRNAKASSSSFGLRSDERANKSKEFVKIVEEKSSAKGAERARLSSKPKEEKDSEIKRLSQRLSFEATPTRGLYQGKGKTKDALYQEGTKKASNRQSESSG